MTKTKPPLPPLRERLKLSDRFVDVTDQHVGERLAITNFGTFDGSARAEWRKIVPEKPDPAKGD